MGAHALNRHFEWKPRRGPFRLVTPEQADDYNRDGFVVLRGIFDPDTLSAVIAEIDPEEAKVEAFLRTRKDGKLFIARADEITFTTHLVTRSERLRAFCSGRVFRDIAFDLLGDDVRLYWDQAVYKKPGTAAPFPWHQDNGYNYIEPQQYLTCWVALTDATKESGCPWVLPGVHKRGTLAHRTSDLGFVCLRDSDSDSVRDSDSAVVSQAAVSAEARAGDIVVFSSLTPHATGPNHTLDTRKAYIVQFAPDGAQILHDGTRTSCDLPERQFPILLGGQAPD